MDRCCKVCLLCYDYALVYCVISHISLFIATSLRSHMIFFYWHRELLKQGSYFLYYHHTQSTESVFAADSKYWAGALITAVP